MLFLFDTHAVIWWFTEGSRVSEDVRMLVGDANNDIYVSAVSAWEIAAKEKAGKLPQTSLLVLNYQNRLAEAGFIPLPITAEHMLRSVALPSEHKDPFDRILAAQALVEAMILISIDPRMAGLGASVRW
jgi:PIN domain nuclease of toxin-antitoxin system